MGGTARPGRRTQGWAQTRLGRSESCRAATGPAARGDAGKGDTGEAQSRAGLAFPSLSDTARLIIVSILTVLVKPNANQSRARSGSALGLKHKVRPPRTCGGGPLHRQALGRRRILNAIFKTNNNFWKQNQSKFATVRLQTCSHHLRLWKRQ